MTAGKKWMQNFLSDTEITSLEQKLIAIDKETRGDIVPLVVHQSLRHLPWSVLLSFILSTAFLTLALLFPSDFFETNHFALITLCLISALGLGAALSHFDFFLSGLIKIFLHPSQVQSAVRDRAELEFYHHHFDQTKNHGAVLIFVSWLERRVHILCDPVLSAKIPQAKWDQIAKEFAVKIKQQSLYQGLLFAIDSCARHLGSALPNSGQIEHEIPAKVLLED